MGLLDRFRRGRETRREGAGAGRPRVLVLALEGLGLPLVRAAVADGGMPALGRLLARAAPVALRTEGASPAVAWATLVTGRSPAGHGIFGGSTLAADRLERRACTAEDLQAAPLWDAVGATGGESVVCGVPFTYPARPMAGALVAGPPVALPSRAVFPPALHERVTALGWPFDAAPGGADRDGAALLDVLGARIDARRDTALALLRDVPWRVAVVALGEGDGAHRWCHDAWTDDAPPGRGAVAALHRRLDAAVGAVADAAGDAGVLLVAPWGRRRAGRVLALDAWLRREGLLVGPAEARTLAELDAATRAVALDDGGVVLLRRDRFPYGSVAPDEAGALATRIADGLLALDDVDGRPVRVVDRGIARWPGAPTAPDLVVECREGWIARAGLGHRTVLGRSGERAAPAPEDAWCAAVGGTLPADGLDLVDVAPTVLARAGVAVPEAMEGRADRMA